ncbi:hypothetical protein [Streptomyces cynarae]|uniref:hypothetical protein n=1 Tax=Streptomyces cynarae TaxID=2981134 RepID=UPI0028BF4456|nr:hypothetical protein [Streptomyces cynarae]
MVVRLHESRGDRVRAALTPRFPVGRAEVTGLLERPLRDSDLPRAATVPDSHAAGATRVTTCVPRPSRRCGRSCGCRGSCRRPAWWWCRGSR